MNPSEWYILVVEDEFDSIQMLSKILTHHGARVEVAKSGFECLKALETAIPTLIIMDLALPGMDGWETLDKIRQNPRTAHIPVVAITAYHSPSVAEDAHHAGFNAYLPKPLDTNAFVQQIAGVIGV
jgi:two-component system cell cycle response regulator DivK